MICRAYSIPVPLLGFTPGFCRSRMAFAFSSIDNLHGVSDGPSQAHHPPSRSHARVT